MANRIQRLRDRAAAAVRSVWSGPITSNSPELARLWADPPAAAGIAVNERSALNYSAVFDAVWTISVQMASFPLIHYKRLPNGGKERFTGSQLYELLDDAPNPEMTAPVFRETLQAHALTWGNAYAEIERDGAGRAIALWPITPDRVAVLRDKYTQAIFYDVSREGSGSDQISSENMLHIPGLGFDGTMGYSVIAKARESLSLGLATERFGGAFFGNGSTFGGVLQHPGNVTKDLQQQIREGIDKLHNGPDRAHKFLVLGGGMKYERLGIPPEDAQFLETRQFQIEEVCRWFHLPPHKLKKLDRATNNNIEHQNIEYYIDCLAPWCKRWEKEIKRKLIPRAERRIQLVEHLVDGMLRGDVASRYAAYAVGRQWGWLSADDVREKENLNPIPKDAGKIYLVPQNMAPADRINDIIDKQVEPTPTPVAPAAPVDPGAAPARDALSTQITTLQTTADTLLARAAAIEATLAQATAETVQALTTEATTLRAQAAATLSQLAAMTILRDEAEATIQQTREDMDERIATGLRLAEQAGAAERRALDAEAARDRSLADVAAVEAIVRAAVTERDMAEQRATEAAQFAAAATTDRTAAEAARDDAQRLATEAQATADAREAERLAALRVAAEATADAAAAPAAADRLLTEALTRAEAAEARAAAADTTVSVHTTEAVGLRTTITSLERERDEALALMATADARATAEAQARTAAETTTQTQRQAELARLTNTLSAHRGLIVDAMGRMVRREAEKARRHQATPEKLRSWIDAFYVTHEDTCVEALLPAVRVHLAWTQSADDADTVTRTLVREHIRESVRQLRAAAHDPDDLHVSLERMLQRWEADRPAAVADRILREEIEHVRTYRV